MENNLINIVQNSIMSSYVKSDDIVRDMCGIIVFHNEQRITGRVIIINSERTEKR